MSTLADNAMLVVRALTRAKKDGLSFYELHQATRLAAKYLPGILHMLEQQGWVVSALVDGIEPPKRLWHLRKQAKETFGRGLCRSPYRLLRRPNPAFHRALAICLPQLGAPLGFRTIQACPKDLPVPSGAS